MEYVFKIGMEGQNKPAAERSLNNLLSIRKKLNDADLEVLARLLEKNPGIIDTAKKMLG